MKAPTRGDAASPKTDALSTGATANLGTLPERELAALVQSISAGIPWARAIGDPDLPVTRTKEAWFKNAAKARFYGSLETPGREWALDVGPGSGVIAAALSARFRHVVALERHPLWCRFMRCRFEQDAVDGARPVQGDGLSIPLRDASLDLVVVNGVLEWVPDTAPEGCPRAAQLRFLQGVRSKLRPGGALGIAIENRWGWNNFLGSSPHGEPRFAVILPRRLADRRSRRLLGRPYRTWIYGPVGYRRLLRDAGFRDVCVYAALPSYHSPQAALHLLDGPAIRPYYTTSHRAKGLVWDILAELRVLGFLSHSFYISARR